MVAPRGKDKGTKDDNWIYPAALLMVATMTSRVASVTKLPALGLAAPR